MFTANAAVVGNKNIGSVGGSGKETEQEFGIFIDAACRNRDDFNAFFAAVFLMVIQVIYNGVGMMCRCIQHKKQQPGPGMFTPAELGNGSIQGSMNRFFIIAAAVSMLIVNELHGSVVNW